MKITVIHGPNLNLLGTREPEVYGTDTLDDIDNMLREEAAKHGSEIKSFQSNSEGEIVDALHQAREWADVVIINPGAYTHTSVAICDAILAIEIPVIEAHLSNVHAREEFRRHSYIAPAVTGQVIGFGAESYRLALLAALTLKANTND